MMAAIAAAEDGQEVILFEKNEKPGKKLYITGKGRCNLTNDTDPAGFIKNVCSNPKFLLSALNAFPPRTTMDFFENAGLPLKVERGGRVFPASDKSSDVTAALVKRLTRAGVTVKLKEKVQKLILKDNRVTEIVTDKGKYFPSAVIIATGGKSYSLTGSTGDGYIFAKETGHNIVEPKPALCPILLKGALDASGAEIASGVLPFPEGLSLKNITASVKERSGKTLFSEFGELLFTDKGVSGPVILTLSSKINRKNPKDLLLSIDLKPALTHEELDARVRRDFLENVNRQFKNSLNALLPKSLIPYIVALSLINPESAVNIITRAERAALVGLLKDLTFPIASLGSIEESIVTAGGVSVKDIDPRTMRSKLVDNLYFAGEVIDVDGFTGGYNIQIALSTGYAAGKNIL